MAPKRNHVSSSRATRKLNHIEEWVESVSDVMALNQLVVHGVMPDRATTRWRPVASESFPTPHGDELVVLKITSITDLVF
jgi:hypothetical protein